MKKLKILILEDLPSDAELAIHEIKLVVKNGEYLTVDNARDFKNALSNFNPDLIVSDYMLPDYTGLDALKLAQKKLEFIPFVILTGSMNEDTAVECMKAGADDYVIKEHIKRLGPAVLHAINSKRIEKERIQAIDALKDNEQKLRNYIENAPNGIFVTDVMGNYVEVNKAAEIITGYSSAELLKMNLLDLIDDDYKEYAKNHFESVVRIGYAKGELPYIKKDGSKNYWLIDAVKISENKFLGFANEITARKKAEETLELEKKTLKFINEIHQSANAGGTLQDIIDVIDKSVNALFNVKATGVYLLSKDKNYLEMINFSLPESWVNNIEQTIGFKIPQVKINLNNSQVYKKLINAENPSIITDKNTINKMAADFTDNKKLKQLVPAIMKFIAHKAVISAPLKYENKVIGLIDISRDTIFTQQELSRFSLLADQFTLVIHRKVIDEELKESEERFRGIFENATIGLYRTSPQGEILLANKTLLKMLGYSSLKELSVRNLNAEGFEPEYPRSVFQKNIEAHGIVNAFESKWKRKDGTTISVRESARAVYDESGQIRYYEGTVEDITQSKKTEKALQESEERFRLTTKAGKTGVWDWNLKTNEIYLEPYLKEMLGYDDHEIKNHMDDWIKYVYPEDVDNVFRAVDLTMQKEGTLFNTEHRMMHKDGSLKWFLARGSLIRDKQGNPVRMVGTDTDITDRKMAEEERSRVSIALEQTADAVVITGTDGNIVYVNTAFERLTGYNRNEAIGQNPRILKSGLQTPDFYKDLWETIISGNIWRGKMINRKKDGSLFTEEATISPIIDKNQKIINFVATKRDITKELKLEAQYEQAQKMESVGRLAGGVAHDFNNKLSVILGYAELALGKIDPANSLHADLQEIYKAGRHSADLTAQLLAFARKQTISPRVLDMNETIQKMLKMLRRLIGEDIELIWKPGANVWPVNMDPAQIDQILANLSVNARDAIKGAGLLSIETENVTLDEKYCNSHAFAEPGSYVMLTISDNGIGMDAETRLKIFEPFFTTKSVGEGTGLGLATVYGIIKQNNGLINVYSEPDYGTTFKIYIPRHTGDARELDESGVIEIPRGNGERLLVVEDEKAILDLASTMLTKLKYNVFATDDPSQAIDMIFNQNISVDLLITDVIMPVMNGKELFDHLKTKQKDLKVLYMSGYTADAIAHRGLLESGVQLIQKPFSMPELAVKINQILNK